MLLAILLNSVKLTVNDHQIHTFCNFNFLLSKCVVFCHFISRKHTKQIETNNFTSFFIDTMMNEIFFGLFIRHRHDQWPPHIICTKQKLKRLETDSNANEKLNSSQEYVINHRKNYPSHLETAKILILNRSREFYTYSSWPDKRNFQ